MIFTALSWMLFSCITAHAMNTYPHTTQIAHIVLQEKGRNANRWTPKACANALLRIAKVVCPLPYRDLSFQLGSLRRAKHSPDGTRLGCLPANERAPASIHDAHTGTMIKELCRCAFLIKFSPDSRYIAVNHGYETSDWHNRYSHYPEGMHIFDRDGNELCAFNRTFESFSPDSSKMIVSKREMYVCTIDTTPVEILVNLGHLATAAEFSPDSSKVIVEAYPDPITVYDMHGNRLYALQENNPYCQPQMLFSPDSSCIIDPHDQNTIIRNATTHEQLYQIEPDPRPRFSPNGRRLISHLSGIVRLRDATHGNELPQFTHRVQRQHPVFSPHGTYIISAATQSIDKNKMPQPLPEGPAQIPADFNTFGYKMVFILWDSTTGRLLHKLQERTREIIPNYNSMVFSPDESYIAINSDERNTRVWETKTGTLLSTVPSQDIATFSPDGSMIATASTIRKDFKNRLDIWDTVSGRFLHRIKSWWIPGHPRKNTVQFSPDSRAITIASRNYFSRWKLKCNQEEETPLKSKTIAQKLCAIALLGGLHHASQPGAPKYRLTHETHQYLETYIYPECTQYQKEDIKRLLDTSLIKKRKRTASYELRKRPKIN